MSLITKKNTISLFASWIIWLTKLVKMRRILWPSMMEILGVLIENYEMQNVTELTHNT
ncbi:hypothetical protein BN873_980122 [Candidatus Competibacter denitrificans Run_A_D11]|uniref:Uncharacterized protein n=1 Tax=Candidatus Competibacter denitrificans Run_A_D11 TaxID=1400863 RepID=W6M930_9GAMM|nr:hypothetical protein BN873_980122 [Candidatus Competibacter denitrificans Run_A_D11]